MTNFAGSVYNSTASLLLALILCMALGSCAEEEQKPPAELIPESDFVEILVELNLIEALRSMHLTQEKASKIATEAHYNHLWQARGISQERFTKSFDYYRADTERMSVIYQQVADRIKRREDLLLEEERQALKDQERE